MNAESHKLERYPHRERASQSGHFKKTPLCDCCNKPVGTNYYTDDEVCKGSDDPGFYLCERKRCAPLYAGLTVAQRAHLFGAVRASRK